MRRETTAEPSLGDVRAHGTGVVRDRDIPGGAARPRTSVRKPALRVEIVDECPLIVQGLLAMLTPYRTTIEVHPAEPGMGSPGPVDVTLYDPTHREPTSRTTLHTLLVDPGHGRLVVYAFNPPPALVSQWLAQGCAAFVDKAAPAEKLVEVITSVATGQPAVVRGAEQVCTNPCPDSWPGRVHGLSRRESEMICLITCGLTNDDICDRTELRLNTVKTYIRSAYHKLGVSRRAEAVRWGVQHGMLDPSVRYVVAAPQLALPRQVRVSAGLVVEPSPVEDPPSHLPVIRRPGLTAYTMNPDYADLAECQHELLGVLSGRGEEPQPCPAPEAALLRQ